MSADAPLHLPATAFLGAGSMARAIIAGLLMGEIVSLTTFFAPKLAELVIFIVMAIVLLVRPSGLFGEAGLAE